MGFVEGINWGHKRLIQLIVEAHWKTSPEKKLYNYNELIFILDAIIRDEGKPYQEGVKNSINYGYNNFRLLVQHLLYRNLANFDSMVLLTGDKGIGKSSIAIMIAREWCRLLGIKFNPARHIAYTNADVQTKIKLLSPFEPLVCDESINFVSSENWSKSENKNLKKLLGQCRTKHLLFILCFPLKIYKVDKTYLENYVNYWALGISRGLGAVFVKDQNPTKDPWRIKDFEKIGSYTEFTDVNKIKEKLKSHPNFWQLIKFPKPSDALYSKYLKVREKNVYDDGNVLANINKEDIFNALIILTLRDIMLHDSNLSMNRILLHIKNEYDMSLQKLQLQESIDDAKQLIAKIKEENLNINEFDKPIGELEIATPIDEEEDENEDGDDTGQLELDEKD